MHGIVFFQLTAVFCDGAVKTVQVSETPQNKIKYYLPDVWRNLKSCYQDTQINVVMLLTSAHRAHKRGMCQENKKRKQ
jgi:hypothetical protein